MNTFQQITHKGVRLPLQLAAESKVSKVEYLKKITLVIAIALPIILAFKAAVTP